MNSSVVAAVGLLALVVAVVGYVHHRRHDGEYLRRDAQLASSLRSLADGDPVRLAAVDEFETTIYRRLFAASTVGPRMVAAAWSLGALVLSLSAAVIVEPVSGAPADVAFYLAIVSAVVFALATLTHAGRAAYAATSVPRISFDDPDPDAAPDTGEAPG